MGTVNSEKALAEGLMNGIAEIATYNDIKTVNLDPILECRFVDQIVGDFRSDLCRTAVPGLYTVTLMLAVIVILIDVGLVFLCRGQRRFGNIGEAAPDSAYGDYYYEHDESKIY